MFRSCWHHLTHHRKLPGQTDVRWTWFQTASFPEVLAPSLHQAKSCKKECWRFASNAFFGSLKMNYYTVKSFLVRIVRTVFRTHRQERWLDCTCLKKKICSNCRESPQWPPKQMASRQALLGKDILDTEPGVAGTTLLITVNCQDRVMSGGHGFKLYRSRRCWLHHCIRQKAARKNVGGLPAMPSFVFWKWIII